MPRRYLKKGGPYVSYLRNVTQRNLFATSERNDKLPFWGQLVFEKDVLRTIGRDDWRAGVPGKRFYGHSVIGWKDRSGL